MTNNFLALLFQVSSSRKEFSVVFICSLIVVPIVLDSEIFYEEKEELNLKGM